MSCVCVCVCACVCMCVFGCQRGFLRAKHIIGRVHLKSLDLFLYHCSVWFMSVLSFNKCGLHTEKGLLMMVVKLTFLSCFEPVKHKNVLRYLVQHNILYRPSLITA